MNQLKTALVTGAGQGMGAIVAKQLATKGIRVIVNDLDQTKAQAVATDIEASGGQAIGCAFDVTDLTAVRAQLEVLAGENIVIDILVNNAGNAGAKAVNQSTFRQLPAEEWDDYLKVNLYGVLNCTKAVIDGMCERGWGRVITISSEAGRQGLDVNVSVYGVAKAGAAHLMRHLAREVSADGVTTNVISLGLMDNVPEEFADRIIRQIPARRLGTGYDVAGAVNYLASDEASWVTGQTLVVNGGSLAC